MAKALRRVGRVQKIRIPAIPLILSISILIALAPKTPEIMAIIIAELTKLIQYHAIRSHLDVILVMRDQQQVVLENLSQRLLTSGEWMPVEINSRSLTLGSKIRYMLVASVLDVSVIVPTWNEEKYLPRCLRSLVNQSSNVPFEVIVVDGGSTDKTVEIAKQYADKVLIKPRQPVGAARNTGAEQASGDIVAFIDADTIASEKWLDGINHAFETDRQAVGVTGPTLPYEGTRLDALVYDVATGWFQRLSLTLGLPHVAGFNCAYRKDAFWDAGGFDEHRQLSEDIMLSLRIRHQGLILFNPEMVAYTSLRRIKKYGYTYLTTYYLMNWATMLLLNRTLAYPKVR